MFHSFYFSSKMSVLISLFTFFQFYFVLCWGGASAIYGRFSFCLLTITKSVRLAEIMWSFCISKFQRRLCILFFRTNSGLYIYHLFVWSDFRCLHYCKGITFPTQSCLFLYSFSASLIYQLIWLIVSSLSTHNLYLQVCCFSYTFAYRSLSLWWCFELLFEGIQFLS